MSGTRDRGGGIDIGNYVNIENYVNEGDNLIERPHTPRAAARPKSATLVQSFLSASPYTSSVTPTNLFAVSPRLPEKPVQFVSGPPRSVLGLPALLLHAAPSASPPPAFMGWVLTTRTTSTVCSHTPPIHPAVSLFRSRPCRRTSTCPTSRHTSSIRPSRTSPAYALAFMPLALAVRPRGKRATL